MEDLGSNNFRMTGMVTNSETQQAHRTSAYAEVKIRSMGKISFHVDLWRLSTAREQSDDAASKGKW